ncbi:hypothetical protein ACFL1D_00780 [Candidatus Omnitrophota bacterium]
MKYSLSPGRGKGVIEEKLIYQLSHIACNLKGGSYRLGQAIIP